MQSITFEGENPCMNIAATIKNDGSLIGAALFLNDEITLYYRIIDNKSNIEIFPFDEATAEQLNVPTSLISEWYMNNRARYNN